MLNRRPNPQPPTKSQQASPLEAKTPLSYSKCRGRRPTRRALICCPIPPDPRPHKTRFRTRHPDPPRLALEQPDRSASFFLSANRTTRPRRMRLPAHRPERTLRQLGWLFSPPGDIACLALVTSPCRQQPPTYLARLHLRLHLVQLTRFLRVSAQPAACLGFSSGVAFDRFRQPIECDAAD